MSATVRTHSGVFEALKEAGRFYYYLRLLDPNGNGNAVVNVHKTIEDLGIARTTFYKYTQDERFVRNRVQLEKGTFRIFYHGVEKVCISLMVGGKAKHLGTVVEMSLEDLANWREYITIGEAITLQYQSKHAASAAVSKQDKKKLEVMDVEKIFEEKTNAELRKSDNGSGLPDFGHAIHSSLVLKTAKKSKRVILYVDGNTQLRFGGSQETIARNLGVSVRTVQRRLRTANKVQQAYTNESLTKQYAMEKFLGEEDWTTYTKRYFKVKFRQNKVEQELFQSYTNLYEPNQVPIISGRNLRKRLNYRLDYILNNNTPEEIMQVYTLTSKEKENLDFLLHNSNFSNINLKYPIIEELKKRNNEKKEKEEKIIYNKNIKNLGRVN